MPPAGLYTREQAYVTFDRLRRALQQTGTGGALSATEIFNTCSPAVCYVEVYDQQGQVLGTGSAFAVESNGKLLTNYHVIQGVYSAKVKFPDGAVYDVQKVMAYDAARDVAVLKIDAQGLATLPLGDSSALVSDVRLHAGQPPRAGKHHCQRHHQRRLPAGGRAELHTDHSAHLVGQQRRRAAQ